MKKDKVVKIDSELIKEVEEFINKKENRIRYSGKKQFVDIAVFELLEKEKNNKKRKYGIAGHSKTIAVAGNAGYRGNSETSGTGI